jgi:hypothetical protein
MNILSPGTTNAKLRKESEDVVSGIAYMAPADSADGRRNLCPWAGNCAVVCISETGRMIMPNARKARVRKALLFLNDRAEWYRQIEADIDSLIRKANRENIATVAVRTDGTTDTGAGIKLARLYPMVQFYDYTKSMKRAERFARGELPDNYHLTFSRSETTSDYDVRRLVKMGVNVAVVFTTVPETYLQLPVFVGDKSDWRFKDPVGHVIGLTAKGPAKHDRSGFVVRAA